MVERVLIPFSGLFLDFVPMFVELLSMSQKLLVSVLYNYLFPSTLRALT